MNDRELYLKCKSFQDTLAYSLRVSRIMSTFLPSLCTKQKQKTKPPLSGFGVKKSLLKK
jgi:hypothetical protein